MDAFSKVSIVSNYRTGAISASNGDVLEGLSQLAFANNNEIALTWFPDAMTSFSDSLLLTATVPLPFSDGTGEGSGDTGGNGGNSSGTDGLFGTGGNSTGSGRGDGVSGGPVQVFAGMSLNWLNRTISQLERTATLMGRLTGSNVGEIEGLDDYAQACLDAAEMLRTAADELADLLDTFPDALTGASASEIWSSLWGLELRSILTGAATLFQEFYNAAPPDGVAGMGWTFRPASFWGNPFMGVPAWLTGDSTIIEDFFAALDHGWLNGGVPFCGSGNLSGWPSGNSTGLGSCDGGNGNSGTGRSGTGDTGTGDGGTGDTGTGTGDGGMGDGTGGVSGLFGSGNSASALNWDVSSGNSDWLSPMLLTSPAMTAATDYYDALSLASSAPAPVTALDDWLSALLPSDGLAPFAFTASSYATTLPDAFATGVRLDTQS